MKNEKNRIVSIVGLLLSLSIMAYSKENGLKKLKKNSIDLSLGGTGLFASVNYSRKLSFKSNYFINASIGTGTVPFIGGISFPHQLTFNFRKKNSIQLEAGGHGMFYSINYERIIFNADKFKTAAQAGFSYYPKITGVRDFWIPLLVNEIFSFQKHHIELGAGYVIIREASRDIENNPVSWFWSGVISGRIAYR